MLASMTGMVCFLMVQNTHHFKSWQNCTIKKKKKSIARNSTGYAIIDEQKFPGTALSNKYALGTLLLEPIYELMLPSISDMAGLAKYGQSKGVSMGFYSDNCRCHESGATHYQQDAHLSEVLGFDSIKIDSCGNQRNMTEWASLFAKEDHPMLVESCGNGPSGTNPKKDDVPMAAWVDMLKVREPNLKCSTRRHLKCNTSRHLKCNTRRHLKCNTRRHLKCNTRRHLKCNTRLPSYLAQRITFLFSRSAWTIATRTLVHSPFTGSPSTSRRSSTHASTT
jgi:hypothetical protein